MADWRSGILLGAGYAIVVEGKVLAPSTSKEELRAMWAAMTKRINEPAPFPENLVKQICYVLPPWESPARPEEPTIAALPLEDTKNG